MELGQDGRSICLLKQPVVLMKPSINVICCYGGLNDPTNVPFRIILQMFDYYNKNPPPKLSCTDLTGTGEWLLNM